MKTIRLFTFLLGLLAVSTVASAQSVQFSGSNNATMTGKSGLTVDVEKNDLNAVVNIYSYDNSIYVLVSDVTSFKGVVGIFNLQGQMLKQVKVDNNSFTKIDMPDMSKGIYVVKAIVNNKAFSKKIYIK